MDTRLASAIRRAIIANQSRSRFDFSAIVFSAKSCARRRTHHEREMIYSRVNQYTPVVFAERIERLVQTFPTRRISKDRLRPVICCSRFAGINFYGLVSPFLYGSPPRELPCVIDGGRAHAGKPRLESLRQVSSPLSPSSYSSSFLRSSRLFRSLSLLRERFSPPFSFST